MTDLRLATWAAYCVLAFGLWACGGESSQDAGDETAGSVHGTIDVVEARSLLEVSLLEITDEHGNRWRFEAKGYDGFSPSHLREHKLQGLPVTVTYHMEDGVRMIDEIID